LGHGTLILIPEAVAQAAERVRNRFESRGNALTLLVGLRSGLLLYLVHDVSCRLFRGVYHLSCCLFRGVNNPAIPGRSATALR